MKRIFALLLAMARGVDEPADPLYLLSEEFEGAVRPWADSEQRTSFWTMLEDGSNIGFPDLEFDEDKRSTPQGSLQPLG